MRLQIGSLWCDHRGQEFEILELGDGENPWVHYANIRTDSPTPAWLPLLHVDS